VSLFHYTVLEDKPRRRMGVAASMFRGNENSITRNLTHFCQLYASGLEFSTLASRENCASYRDNSADPLDCKLRPFYFTMFGRCWTPICTVLGCRRHQSICCTRLFTTPLVVITIFGYNQFLTSDVLSRSGPMISSLFFLLSLCVLNADR
jgi:hypothetical protein